MSAAWERAGYETGVAGESPRTRLTLAEWLMVALIVVGIAARFAARPHAPFWLDEAATGAIVSEPTFAGFWKNVYWHVSSPLYFLFMRAWSILFGFSNEAMRLPSTLMSIAAPLWVAAAPLKGLSRLDRLCWAALLALWIPGVGYAQVARPYALELFFATAQTLAFVRLLHRTTLSSTALWVGAAALAISTHYLAGALALVQGLVFLVLKRGDAVKQWPALLLITPALAVIAWQWPEMARFMTPGTSWYRVYGIAEIRYNVLYLLGSEVWGYALAPLMLGAVALGMRYRDRRPVEFGPYLFVGISSVLAAAFLIAAGTARPMMTARYLAPFAPGVMLFLLVIIRSAARVCAPVIVSAIVAVQFCACALWLLSGAHHPDSAVEDLSYQYAADRIMASGAKSVVFLWDNPNARAMHLEQVANYGRFFFRRAGYNIEVIPVAPSLNANPNELISRIAKAHGSAILWVYDPWVAGTRAVAFPPALARLNPQLDCPSDLTSKPTRIGILTCVPKRQ